MLHPFCNICGNVIEGDRLNVLLNVLNLPPSDWKCIGCANATDQKVKGIYTGFSGASNMILTNSIGRETGLSHIFPDLSPPLDETGENSEN